MTIKVLHLIDSGGLYGAEVVLLNLVEEQIKQGLQPLILSAGTPDIEEKPLERAARERGLPIKKWRMKAGLNLPEAWKILKFAKQEGIQILHSHGYKFNLLMGIWPKAVRGIPLIATLHGYVNAPKYTKMWLYELLDKAALSRMEAVVVVNAKMKELPALSRISEARLALIENGIKLDKQKENAVIDAKTEAFFARHPTTIGAIGRLSREKGLGFLIDAFARLAQRFPELGLLIVGEGREREALEAKIANAGLEQRVLLAGYQKNVTAYLSRLECLVMPSLTEGLPMTLLEAMAARVPVVASAVGGIPDALRQGALGELVKPGNIEDLERAIAQVLKDKVAARQRADLAGKQVEQRYSASSMALAYHRLYDEVRAAQLQAC